MTLAYVSLSQLDTSQICLWVEGLHVHTHTHSRTHATSKHTFIHTHPLFSQIINSAAQRTFDVWCRQNQINIFNVWPLSLFLSRSSFAYQGLPLPDKEWGSNQRRSRKSSIEMKQLLLCVHRSEAEYRADSTTRLRAVEPRSPASTQTLSLHRQNQQYWWFDTPFDVFQVHWIVDHEKCLDLLSTCQL